MTRRFEPGMTCCNHQRRHIGLECDIGAQLACAASSMKWAAEYAPETLPSIMRDVVAAFPTHVAWLRVISREAEALELFVHHAALYCATLPSKTERRAYRAQLEFEGGTDELGQFDQLMAAEWCRLRGKPVSGDPK